MSNSFPAQCPRLTASLPAGPYTFDKYEAWQRPGLQPAPSEALKLLHRLAADPGIVGIMTKHRHVSVPTSTAEGCCKAAW